MVEVDEHRETQPTQDDGEGQRPDDEPVPRVGYETPVLQVHQARVAEAHDGMEDALKDALCRSHPPPDEGYAQRHGRQKLDSEGDPGYLQEEPQDVTGRVHALYRLAHCDEVPKAHSLPDEQRRHGRHGHDPKSSKLDQHHDHDGPERREGGRKIHRREAGYASRANRYEHGVNPRDAVLGGDREFEEHGPQRHQREKADNDQPGRRKLSGQHLLPDRGHAGSATPGRRPWAVYFDCTLTSERRYNPLRASDRHRPERMLCGSSPTATTARWIISGSRSRTAATSAASTACLRTSSSRTRATS